MPDGPGRPLTHHQPMRQITLYLPVKLIDALDVEAKAIGESRSRAATFLLTCAMEEEK